MEEVITDAYRNITACLRAEVLSRAPEVRRQPATILKA